MYDDKDGTMKRKALPLDDENAPRRCSANPDIFCPEHSEMVNSRAMGVALIGVAKFAIPLILLIITAILGFLYRDVTVVEAKFDAASKRHEEVHQMVHNIDYNLRALFGALNMDYISQDKEDG